MVAGETRLDMGPTPAGETMRRFQVPSSSAVLDLPGSKSVHENRVHCTFEWPVEWFFLGDVEPNSLSLTLSLEAWKGSSLLRSLYLQKKENTYCFLLFLFTTMLRVMTHYKSIL